MATRRTVSKAHTPAPPGADELAAREGAAMQSAHVSGPPSADQGHRTGADQPPGFDYYGITGLQRFGTVSRVYEEFLRELQGPQGMNSYREMKDNDPIIGAILFAASHLCRKVKFSFKPANDSPEAKKVAEFCGSAIFDDMDSSWPDTLSEILTMLPYGWALMEFRMKRRLGMSTGEVPLAPPMLGSQDVGGVGYKAPDFVPSRFSDGRIGFRGWSLRAQETLFMWEFDEDSNAVVMQQMAPPDYRIRRIPLSKAFLFRTQVSKNNPEGRSIIRNAWTSYYLKKNLQVFEGIGIERDLAGYPMIQMVAPDPNKGIVPPDVWNPNDPAMVNLLMQMKRIVRSVRRDEQEGIVMPWWAEFKLMSTGSRRSFDTNSIIARYDQRMAMSVMADFIMLGHEAVGSKALASTKISLFTSALSAFLDIIGAIVDRQAVPVLLKFNGIPQELAPSMQHGDVENLNMAELGDFIAKIAGTGVNLLNTPEAIQAMKEVARIPSTTPNSEGDEIEGENAEITPPVAAADSTQGTPAALSTV